MDQLAEREFREYVALRQGSLYRVAYLLTGHHQDAEDLLQVALTKLALHWSRVHRSGSPDGYIRKVLYRQHISVWRVARNRREHATGQLPEPRSVEDPAGAAVLKLAMSRVLGELTRKQRAVVVLRYYEDLPEAEVAALMGTSVGTVRSQVHRTLTRLRELCPELRTMEELV
ncbi:SigE family RNA polymerase sigma factor [Catellatospora sp. KI3]|uniref:SigE family RNA polymerase sigma factor n=1 Tax=Catellatospora sp. KI3 TaxID=3041620 RepID=UPI0024831E81|nr:SigE family RNA polymerase sigma factor [Catellatospora sp. KI3]MDI1463124.1 SigE family RNA polymerase sigma factor [Catellatospora sp. KI3]